MEENAKRMFDRAVDGLLDAVGLPRGAAVVEVSSRLVDMGGHPHPYADITVRWCEEADGQVTADRREEFITLLERAVSQQASTVADRSSSTHDRV